ncbi:hypothetical protein GGR54DRAFT_636265 [Hypoxylon sp. NC1633]|nr:hypothetical protein GGR54DRAFT_636265 [Hypoxylon sp. NC1633]
MSRSQSPRRPHQKGSRHGSGTATPRSSRRGTGSTEPIVTNLPTDSSLPSPTEPNSSAWSTAVSDLHALLNFTGEMEPFTGSEFDFASGFPGLAPLSQGDHSPSALQASLSDNISSLFGLQSVPGTVDSTTGLLTAPPTRTQSGQGLSSSLSSEPLNTPMTSSTSSSGQKCGCLCALLTIFEETGVQVASNKDMPTDCLFQCLQEGIQKCQAMLVCPDCDTSAKNPILLATLGNQLVVIAGEIVSRFTQCQSRDTVPTVFQFGRYSIKCADMRTRLLRDMIALHVRDLYDLLDRSKLSIGNMQGPLSLLESAKLDVTKLHELLSQNSEHGESR